MEDRMLNSDRKIDDNEGVVYKPLSFEKPELLVTKKGGEKKETLFLYFCALTVNLITFVSGCSLVWSSPAIPKLKSSDPDINPLGSPITALQESWIAALPPLGATLGPLLTGKLADAYGRKKALILLAVLKMASYIVLAFATDINLYYATRLLLGVAVGMNYAVLPSYVGEICDDHNRGKFGCIMGLFLTTGVLYTIAVGPHVSLKLLTLSCAVPLIITIFCFLVIPETPVYLAATGKRKEATKALMKLRGITKEAAEKDMIHILHLIDESSKSSRGGLCILQQIAGINAIMAFIEPIFNLTGSEIPPNISSILVAVVQILGIAVASVIVEKLGRKFLLLFSTISCTLSLGTLGLYFYLKQAEASYVKNIFWLPIASLIIFMLVFNIGLGPVPWALVSEMFPSNVKASAASLATSFCGLSAFVVTFSFPFMMEFMGPAICFWMFGGVCLVGAIIIYFGVPETKGKNIVEIQKML
ncbi:hypothetical protein NQ318_014661, partial [Aromia moschata]